MSLCLIIWYKYKLIKWILHHSMHQRFPKTSIVNLDKDFIINLNRFIRKMKDWLNQSVCSKAFKQFQKIMRIPIILLSSSQLFGIFLESKKQIVMLWLTMMMGKQLYSCLGLTKHIKCGCMSNLLINLRIKLAPSWFFM